jgi:hypothetical protein
MSDFVKNLTDTQAQHATEIAELRAIVAKLELQLNPPQPEPMKVDSRPDPKEWTHEERMAAVAADAEARRAKEKAQHDEARVGLEPGYWRDNCGLIRDSSGKIALTGEQKRAEAAKFEEEARKADLAWRRSVELPIRVNGYLPQADEAVTGGSDEDYE